MTEPKVFRRGRRTYTRVGAHREVRLDAPGKSAEAPVEALTLQVGADVDQPVYANAVAVHRSPDEIILDLAFAAPGRPGARVRSRIAMSPVLARRVASLLNKAAQEL